MTGVKFHCPNCGAPSIVYEGDKVECYRCGCVYPIDAEILKLAQGCKTTQEFYDRLYGVSDKDFI